MKTEETKVTHAMTSASARINETDGVIRGSVDSGIDSEFSDFRRDATAKGMTAMNHHFWLQLIVVAGSLIGTVLFFIQCPESGISEFERTRYFLAEDGGSRGLLLITAFFARVAGAILAAVYPRRWVFAACGGWAAFILTYNIIGFGELWGSAFQLVNTAQLLMRMAGLLIFFVK